tara:strand:- start:1285 stop:1596 length:312 start_codon:yes stop_codon:yes gene_type:complete
MSSSPSGTGANDVAPKPGLARRAVGWLLIVVSPVPAAFPFVITFLLWDQVPRPPFPPSWAIPFFLMSYLACTVALLWPSVDTSKPAIDRHFKPGHHGRASETV